MIFSETYCSVSYLPIKENDWCYLIPLRFQLATQFNGEINLVDLKNLYRFMGTYCLIKYKGNVSYDFDWTCKEEKRTYQNHFLFMLVHKKFFEQVIESDRWGKLENIEELPSPISIYEAKLEFQFRSLATEKHFGKLRNLTKLAVLMEEIGIVPTLNWAAGNKEISKEYELARKKFSKEVTDKHCTYCGFSRLPIYEGEACYLFPMFFEMRTHWRSDIDSNMLAYLWQFTDDFMQVTFCGEEGIAFDYCTEKEKAHFTRNKYILNEPYLLIHKGFFDTLWQNYPEKNFNWNCSPLFLLIKVLREKAYKLESDYRNRLFKEKAEGKITIDQVGESIANYVLPEKYCQMIVLAIYIGRMGVQPFPNNGVFDIKETGLLFERFREIKAKNTKQ